MATTVTSSRGTFDFGVAGAKGAAPAGVEKLTGSGGGRGGENAAGDGFVKVVGRWLGILAASLLFGGFVLLALLRRRRDAAGADRDDDAEGADDADAAVLRAVAPITWLLVVLAALEGLLAGASSGAGGSLDLGLLTASANRRLGARPRGHRRRPLARPRADASVAGHCATGSTSAAARRCC